MKQASLLMSLLLAAAVAGAQTPATAEPAAQPAQAAPAAVAPAAPAAPVAPAPQVKIIDLKVGTGAEAIPGQTVRVHYTGWLYKELAPKQRARQFDSSVGREPLEFQLGAGRVIKGWEQGVAGMKVGGKRTLIIPSELGYGKRGAGGGMIPPDADLVFDVELLGVK
jgi:FKBP-type peptidyl-prolyl cis-trans isomerase FkpA